MITFITGDVIIHNALLDSAKVSGNKYNFDYIYTYFKSYVSASDYAVTNLETTLGGSDYTGYPVFNTPDSLLDSITGAGFDMLLTANNHANDTGFNGMSRTARVLNERKIDFIGTVENEGDKRYIVKEINGIKLGMICYTYEGRGRSNDGRKATLLLHVPMWQQGRFLILNQHETRDSPIPSSRRRGKSP